MKHPEWKDEVDQAEAEAANRAEDMGCSRVKQLRAASRARLEAMQRLCLRVMQLRAASRARREVVQIIRHESDKHARRSLDTGKRSKQRPANDLLGIQQMPAGQVPCEKMPPGNHADPDPVRLRLIPHGDSPAEMVVVRSWGDAGWSEVFTVQKRGGIDHTRDTRTLYPPLADDDPTVTADTGKSIPWPPPPPRPWRKLRRL